MKDIGGKNMSKTEENAKKAFAGESQARNKYDYFAKAAKKEGFLYIAKIFEETAENEKQHAKDEFRIMSKIGSTEENLKEAIKGENYEHTEMYPQMQKDAEEEGNHEAAKLFKEIAEVEEQHERRFKKLLKMVEEGKVFEREKPIRWKCGKCGYIHVGTTPPEACPSCKHPKEYYEPECMCFNENCEICKQ